MPGWIGRGLSLILGIPTWHSTRDRQMNMKPSGTKKEFAIFQVTIV
jgi:hypothetical protein